MKCPKIGQTARGGVGGSRRRLTNEKGPSQSLHSHHGQPDSEQTVNGPPGTPRLTALTTAMAEQLRGVETADLTHQTPSNHRGRQREDQPQIVGSVPSATILDRRKSSTDCAK